MNVPLAYEGYTYQVQSSNFGTNPVYPKPDVRGYYLCGVRNFKESCDACKN